MYRVRLTKEFRKDFKRMRKRNRNTDLLQTIVAQLADGKPLAEKHNDHALSGSWAGYRECHIAPDWLLIYRVTDGRLIADRTGTHADLFGF